MTMQSCKLSAEPLVLSLSRCKPRVSGGTSEGPAVRVFLQHGIPRGSHDLADYERGKRIVSELAHGDPAAYQQYLKVLVKYVGV